MTEISAKLVKELREKTGAGMMDCKRALQESSGDATKAVEWLRQKGITSAEKKGGRTTAEGLVDSYIHTGGRIGILVEVNCETDFVARREEFQSLVRNIAMQIAACPNVEYIAVKNIPSEVAQKEKEIEMGRDDLANKPDNIKEKIVQGRIEKRLKEMALVEQPYIRDQSITVDELIKQTIAQLGENIQVRRFVRFLLGEGIEKAESNFADEVAAQTGQKAASPSNENETTAPEKPVEVAASVANSEEVSVQTSQKTKGFAAENPDKKGKKKK